MPGNRKHDGGVEKNTIVIGAIRVLPVIVRVEQQIPADSLLKADVELIALPGLDRYRARSKNALGQPATSGHAGEHEIFVEGCFQSPGERAPQHRSRLLDVVGNAKAGLPAI